MGWPLSRIGVYLRRIRQLSNLSLLIDRLSLGAAQATVVVLIMMMVLITVEVVVRLFGISTRVSDEYSGYMLVAISFWAAAAALKARKHIRITVLTSRLNPKIQSVLYKANFIVAFALIVLLLWTATKLALGSYERGMVAMGTYQIPVFIPQLAIPIGLFFLVLQIASDSFKVFRLPKK